MKILWLFQLIVFSSASLAMSADDQRLIDQEIQSHKATTSANWKRVQDSERLLAEISPDISRVSQKAQPMLTKFHEGEEAAAEGKTFPTPYENIRWKQMTINFLHGMCCRSKQNPDFQNRQERKQQRQQQWRRRKQQ